MKESGRQAFYEFRHEGVSDIQAGMGKNLTFPLHLHEDLELFWVRRGVVNVQIGVQERTMTSGDFAVIFPNVIHSYESFTEENEFYIAICRSSLWGEYLPRLLHYTPKTPFFSQKELHPDIPYAMKGLDRQAGEDPNPEILRALLQLILARLFSKMELLSAPEPKSVDLTSRLVRYLSQNFLRPLSLESIARELGVSRYHLSHIFSVRLKTGFSEYLNFLRLNYACQLLQTTDRRISDIAFDAGFSSQRTFNRTFQKQFSLAPREYRERFVSGVL